MKAQQVQKLIKKREFGLEHAWKNRKDIQWDITWTENNVKALGIYFGHDNPSETCLKEIYEKVDNFLNFWISFYLSKLAKSRVLEIFVSSKLVCCKIY